ncbi:NAC domain-containing protein 82 [Rhynchospora pubera]|uniref:NAC domain-containing protein 82 n=1 Tax=Rhynchospora pubera TaxID=906938 RepID=A0AAV8ELT9_9POAL|nr:NAC domain-containing protein 82 [Rhynchospora pubera]
MAQAFLPPGFRFHPTDEELIVYYLKRKVMGKPFRFIAISDVDLYKFSPWDLPDKSLLRNKDLEWYFFCPRDKKYANGSRANRSTEIGYWKTTGKDRTIVHDSHVVGMKKSLIFHTGKPPKGDRTDWVMYEYRLTDKRLAASGVAQDAYVICKIFKKSGMGPKIGEQYGAPFNEEDWEDDANFEETLAAFPFLPCEQPTGQPCHNNAMASVAEPVPMPVDPAAMVEPAPVSAAITAVLEPVPPSLAAESVAVHSGATGTGSYEELLLSNGPPFCMPQRGTAVPTTPELDGIQLDELAQLFLDSPYHPRNVSGQLAPQWHSPAAANFNESAFDETNGIYNELADLTAEVSNYGNGLGRLGSTGAPTSNSNVEQPFLSELGSQHYVELNDIVYGEEMDNFFLDYCDPAPSPEMDIDAFFSMGPNTSETPHSAPTSDSLPHV